MNIVWAATAMDPTPWLEAIKRRIPGVQCYLLGEEPADWQAHYALVWKPDVELFERHQQLAGLINLGAGVDALLAMPELPQGLPIFKLRDAGMVDWMFDYLHYGVLHFERNFDQYQRQQRDSQWQSQTILPRSHWSIGVLGLGSIGAPVAQRFAALGYQVNGWRRKAQLLSGVHCFCGEEQLESFLASSQILINLLPSTPATKHLLNAERLAQLPSQAVVINAGRGETLEADALLDALQIGRLRGAMLDVFESEPLAAEHPVWQHSAVWVTPHVAAPTPLDTALEQVLNYLQMLAAGQHPTAVDSQLGY